MRALPEMQAAVRNRTRDGLSQQRTHGTFHGSSRRRSAPKNFPELLSGAFSGTFIWRPTYRSEPYTYTLYDKKAGGKKTTIYGYIFYSGLEAEQQRNSLLSTAILWQKAFRRYDFEDSAQAQEWLDTCTNGFGKYLKLKGEMPSLDTELDNGRIEADTARCGFHVVVTTVKEMTAAE